MKRAIYTLTVGLVLAGVVHILIILLIPSYAERDAWAKLAELGEPWNFSIVALPGKQNSNNLPLVDPLFGVAACRFNLAESPLIVETTGGVPFWSVAVFDRLGRNVYSFNDRTAIEKQLFMIVVDPVQMARLRKDPPEETERAVLIESAITEGYILIRGLQDESSRSGELLKFLQSARCGRYDLTNSDTESDVEN